MRLHERGIIATFYLYALAALAVIAALGALYWKISNDSYQRGKTEIEKQWLLANQQAESAATAARQKREAEAATAARDLASANNQARDFEHRWRAAKARPVIAAGQCVPQPANGSAPVVADSGIPASDGLVLRLDAGWLRQYDAAWTNEAGKPFYPDTGVVVDAADAAVTIDAILPIHGENAARSSANFRQCSALIALVRKLRATN